MTEKLGIYATRARMLSGFFDLAQQVFFRQPKTRSVMLSAAQYWSDEAEDAVYDNLVRSTDLVPLRGDEIAYDQRADFAWHANTNAVWAFSATCHEEGWEPETNAVNPELKNIYSYYDSPLMIVQRIGDQLRASWLGAPLRAWLDRPDSLQDARGYRGDEELPLVVPDPPMPELIGRERELYDQVLADPYDRGVRDVLRDLWIQRGDPRGELCTVTSSDDPALRVRAADLVALHGRSWLGALQPVIPLSGALFGYGPFVEEAIVYADQAIFEQVANAPEWGGIERIRFAPGSYRRLVPGMKNARAIGPVTWDQLAPVDRTWKLVDVDIEPGGLPSFELLDVPLRTLRLRVDRMDPSAMASALQDAMTRMQPAPDPGSERNVRTPPALPWKPALDALAWWKTLERVELWLPGAIPDPQREFVRAVDGVVPALRDGQTFAVGMLDGDQRTGWMLVADRTSRRIELVHPDSRMGFGEGLAAATGLPLEPPVLSLPDWLALGLGVPSIRPAPKL